MDSNRAVDILDKFSKEEIRLRIRLLMLLDADSMRAAEDFMAECWLAWEDHPSYKPVDKSKSGWLLSNVVLMAAFSHPPGKYNHCESYVIGTLNTIMSQMEWAKRKWRAKFSRLMPIQKQVEIPDALAWMKQFEQESYREVMEKLGGDESAVMLLEIHLHPFLITTLPMSYAGQGAQMTARLRLKELLPHRLKKYVSKARSGNAKPKHFYFSVEQIREWSTFKNGRRYIKYPAHVRKIPKWKLWFDRFVPLDDQMEIMRLMPLEDFWSCATGKVHPNDVDGLFVPPLFRGAGIFLGTMQAAPKQKRKKKEAGDSKQLSFDF